jgi:hypothetical protein
VGAAPASGALTEYPVSAAAGNRNRKSMFGRHSQLKKILLFNSRTRFSMHNFGSPYTEGKKTAQRKNQEKNGVQYKENR